ncbi:hypothetical protein K432DRAFT_405294 [Lepidopterella palustris CBS 459.81]|uniref:Zn(2)-C6 fungal-type domain-containing protein n=1 Tax=Lepidopterella palustris CBS 459.81 TaxID=1314670 RepID=A0A8E2JER0_9PEZI|nr:hypothetical protein K432DRAFT_405294 [Lepidopterella palustris CBS 459.81]
MFPHRPGGPGQHPSHWNSQPPNSSQPPNGTYRPPSSHIPTSLPPPPTEPRPDMASLQPQPQGYRLPAPHEWNHAPPPPDPYRQGPPPPHMGYAQQQPAPRQRTAIACRYCRRRKIRCSGFEASEDGRCTNCVRFTQDCIFTPVSAQTQAFVPAHAVWRTGGQAPPLFGAFGQPLNAASHPQEAYAPPRQQGYPLPSPTGPYSAPAPAYASASASASGGAYDDRNSRDAQNSRRRRRSDPHTATLPPPNPALASQLAAHRGSGLEYTYPDPTALTPAAVSPASSSASYNSAPHQPPHPQPYYSTQPPRRSSPQSAYSYDPSRTSSSPHTQGAPSTPGTAPYPSFPVDSSLRPIPARSDGRTPPPPTSQPSSRPGMRITDIVSDNAGRSSTDSDMLNALNRRPM